jgi:integrase/recombinase XerD
MADTVTAIPALVATFLEHGRYLRGWSPKTVHCYQHALATFTPERITKQSLQQFVLELQAQGHNRGGINLIQRALNSFLTWAYEQGHTAEHHKVRLLRVPKTVITPISVVEVRRIIAFKPRGRAMRRAHTLVMLLLDCGLRITEALTLERSRVDLGRRCVTVNGKGSRERIVPISVEGRKALFLWMSRSKGRYVFCTRDGGNRLTYRNAYRDIKLVCQKVGVTGAHLHPHALRHAFAVNYVRSGGDIYRLSRALGHSSLTTTSLYLRSMGFESLQEGHRSPLSAA